MTVLLAVTPLTDLVAVLLLQSEVAIVTESEACCA